LIVRKTDYTDRRFDAPFGGFLGPDHRPVRRAIGKDHDLQVIGRIVQSQKIGQAVLDDILFVVSAHVYGHPGKTLGIPESGASDGLVFPERLTENAQNNQIPAIYVDKGKNAYAQNNDQKAGHKTQPSEEVLPSTFFEVRRRTVLTGYHPRHTTEHTKRRTGVHLAQRHTDVKHLETQGYVKVKRAIR
jgi:hypothetical protein